MISPHSRSRANGRRAKRRGLAAVELALLLPLMVFMSMAAVDFARVAYVQVALQNCARNGALYEFYGASGNQVPSAWSNLLTAVQADAGGLTVTVPSTYGGLPNPYSPQSASNNYVTVTVQCTFNLIALGADGSLPSINHTATLTQQVSMPMPASAGTVP